MTHQVWYSTTYKKSAGDNDLQWYMSNPPDILTVWVSNSKRVHGWAIRATQGQYG